jgi:hypothetical protein
MENRSRWDRDWETEESLRRGTIYDRSAGPRGNYDLPEEQSYGSRPDRYYEPGGRTTSRPEGFGRMRGQNRGGWQSGMRYSREDRWDQGYGPFDQGQSGWRSARQDRWDRGYGTYDRGQRDRQNRWDMMEPGREERWDRGYETDWEEDFDQPVYWTYEEWWVVPGPFEGISPRGYQRSDERIFEEVCERMSQHGRLDASNIQVEVKDGEVILSGEVDNRQSKRIAEDVAESVSGVSEVNNQIRVEQRGRPQEQKGEQRSQNR